MSVPDPVHVWCFLSRQRSGRITARNVATIQPLEEWWTGFDFSDLLLDHGGEVREVLWTDAPTLPTLIDETAGYPIQDNVVYVKINVPPDSPDLYGYHGLEVHFRDSGNNRFTGSALLFISKGIV